MICQKDICIGDVCWLNHPLGGYDVYIIDEHTFSDLTKELSEVDLYGIPINTNILEYLGWNKGITDDESFEDIYYELEIDKTNNSGQCFSVITNDNKIYGLIVDFYPRSFGWTKGREIKYFHELENLYYFTTGQHLEVDLDLLEYDKIKELL